MNIYPPQHARLVPSVLQAGAFISEAFPRDRVTRRSLQIRNRLSSGLTIASVFLEGTRTSGTKWQLKFATEQGKPIFTIPRAGHPDLGYVPRAVVKDGGSVIDLDHFDEVLEVLGQ